MTKRNIRRSEKRCRTVVKTSMCLLALIGAYMAAPTVYNKAEGLWQAHQEKQRAQIAKREAQIQERENQIKNQFDAELIAEIEMVEKNGALRYLSAHMAFENIYRKDVAALENGTMSQDEYRKAAVAAVKQLSMDVGIPQDLKDIVKESDVLFLAESAMADACRPGNPKNPTLEDIIALYKSLL